MNEQMIEPCPFCGSDGQAHTHTECGFWIAGCSNPDCIAHQAAYDFVSRETAIAAWNTRAAHSVMAAKIADLEAALEAISSGEAFRIQRFAEDDDPEYFLRVQRYVQQIARYALARHKGTDQLCPMQRQLRSFSHARRTTRKSSYAK